MPGTQQALRNPHVLHGFLIHSELGFDLKNAAKAAGVSKKAAVVAIESAREGLCPKAPFYRGITEVAMPKICGGNVLFPREWHRRSILAMLQPGGTSTVDLGAILIQCGIVSPVGENMKTLRRKLRAIGLDFHGTDSNKPTARYVIDGDNATSIQQIVKRGWALP